MGFFYKAKSSVINFFADIRFYWLGFVLFGNSSYQLKGDQMREILNAIKPGDILLRRYNHYLGSVLVPGHYSHAAIYIGDDRVIHMLGKGITNEDILTFMRCDDVAIMRALMPQKQIDAAIKKAKEYEKMGVEYDYNFDTNSPARFYCTEMTDGCYDYPVKEEIMPRKKIMPDDYTKSGFFEVVWYKG